jgi:hypothetical protein
MRLEFTAIKTKEDVMKINLWPSYLNGRLATLPAKLALRYKNTIFIIITIIIIIIIIIKSGPGCSLSLFLL